MRQQEAHPWDWFLAACALAVLFLLGPGNTPCIKGSLSKRADS